MKLVKKCAVAAAMAAFSLGAPASPAVAAAPTAAEFARVPNIDNVSISPDGKHIVALTSADGQTPTISVWRTDALDQRPVVLGSGKMRFLKVSFLKNDRLLVNAIQTYTDGSTKRHTTKQYVTDLAGENWKSLLPDQGPKTQDETWINSLNDAALISRLALDPKHVIVQDRRLGSLGDIYKVDVYSGAATRLLRAVEDTFNDVADLSGDIRARTRFDYDAGKVYFAIMVKHPDTGAWEEHFRYYAKDRVPVQVIGFDTDPNILYLKTARGTDKAGIYTYDIRGRKILEPLFEHKLFEAGDLVRSSGEANYGEILGFSYGAETDQVYWVDEKLAGMAKGLRNALGVTTTPIDWVDPGSGARAKISTTKGVDAQIIDWSDDLRYTIVEKSGGSQPPEFYLLSSDGKLALLGASRPWLQPQSLGLTRLVQYTARDGLPIPAFLTTPPASLGAGPFPTLILPHGGPWSRDHNDWDVSGWTQYFAARGYAVLQPQFRGSEGWGQKLWRAGDGEWGQKMQDDKDDGAKWLIDQKIADPNRIAMFGYSYGGYAALAAAIRPNGLYQCAISGAGAGDLATLKRATFDNRYQREFQNPTIAGLDALARAREASIPILLYHGDRDQIVELEQSEKFVAQLKAAGKPHKYVEIKDMGHAYVTMTPAMLERQLVEVENFLRSDCGPGGL